MLKILPDNNISECIICMNENKITKNHSCNQCKRKWKICIDCNKKLKICPVCKNQNYNIKNENNTNKKNICSKKVNNILINLIYIILYILKYVSYFFAIVYLGKTYIYSYCSITCEDINKSSKCICGKYANRYNYWGRFDNCILEFLCCIVVSGMLYGCCCIKN
jgi:hypothetical protein